MELLFNEALEKCPSAAWIHSEYASHLKKIGRLPDSISHYLIAHELEPDSPDILLNLSLALRGAGDLPKAMEVLNRSLRSNPSNAQAWNQLGSCYRDTDDLPAAQMCFRRATSINPKYLVAANNLANAVQATGDYDAAAQLFEKAIQIDASNPLVWINYGNCLSLMGRLRHAISAYNRAVMANPRDCTAHYALNKTILEAGDRSEFLRSLSHYPGWELDSGMLRQVARLETLVGGYRRAFDLLSAATVAAPHIAEVWLEFADAAIKTGRSDITCQAVNRGVSLGRSDVSVLISSAQLFKRAGQDAETLRLLAGMPESEKWRPSYVALARSMQPCSGDSLNPNDLDDIYVRRIETPEGYTSVDALNADLLDLLGGMHASSVRPVGQSVYSGTQTMGSLWGRPAKSLAALKGAFASAVSDYLTGRRAAGSHCYWTPPLRGFAFADGWSICVGRGGGHAEHIHPDGWISGVYYVSSPSELWSAPVNGGWLQLASDASSSATEPILSVPPIPGNIVLFPSYLQHSVTEQQVEGARIVVAFDVVPSDALPVL